MIERAYHEVIRNISALKWTGCSLESTNYGPFTILDYKNNKEVTVEFERTGTVTTISLQSVREGCVQDIMQPSLCGIAALGVPLVEYDRKTTKKAYRSYVGLIERVYTRRESNVSYEGCSVVPEWLYFENYKPFFVEDPFRQEGWHLDKDLLFQGNKVYGPDTSCFIPPEINACMLIGPRVTNGLPTGVCFDTGSGKYIASINNSNANPPVRGLKRFSSIEEAFDCYRTHKESVFKMLAEKWKGLILPEAYEALINRKIYE